MSHSHFKEEWRPIEGWPHDISDFGRVRRSSKAKGTTIGSILKTGLNKGYPSVHLSDRASGYRKRKLCRIHTLVAKAFLGPRPNGLTINHIDGDKTNNKLSNLEYISHLENMQHANRLHLIPIRRGESHPLTKLSDKDVIEMRRLHQNGTPTKEISRKFNLGLFSTYKIINRKTWRHI